ncbi:MAG: hypothetical protein ACI4AQ_04395 [Lachnospiraceae bacterium]
MEMHKQEFNYTYSAKEQEELKRIRQKYEPKEEDKMEQLRRLDASANKKPTLISLCFGIIGVLIMGSGMSLTMTNLGNSLGLSGVMAMIMGIVIGLIGLALACLAYPVYKRIAKEEHERIAPEIIRLTDELMK